MKFAPFPLPSWHLLDDAQGACANEGIKEFSRSSLIYWQSSEKKTLKKTKKKKLSVRAAGQGRRRERVSCAGEIVAQCHNLLTDDYHLDRNFQAPDRARDFKPASGRCQVSQAALSNCFLILSTS